MSQSAIIITAADAHYFEWAQGCIASVREKPAGSQVDIGFLDLGCTQDQKTWLISRVNRIVEPPWEYCFPSRDRQPGYLRGLLGRPFLQRYFPGYEVYLWIDADAWLQDWQAVDLLLQGARLRRGLAIVPELHRGHRTQYGGLPQWWRKIHDWYAQALGNQVAERLCSFPMLNAGVFALHRDAPHWQAWEVNLRDALQKSCTLYTDQLVLNYVVYYCNVFQRTELLPAWCNWTCHLRMPCWDEQRASLVEPYLPNTPIGILHLTADKHESFRLTACDGSSVQVELRYPGRRLS